MMKTITNNFKLWIITLVGIIAAACSDPSAHLPETPEVNIYSDLSFLFAREGGQNHVSFETNRPWTAKVLNSPEWVTISKDSGNAGKHEIVITVSEQPDGADYREAVLVINSSAAGKDIHIMQSGKPIVLTSEATGISENTATLKGSWIYSGDDISVTEYGFALKAGDGAFEKKTVQTRDESTGAFTLALDDLQAETEYTFHSYAVTSENEEVCGTDLMFKTPAMPTIMTIAEFKTYTREHVSKGGTSVLNENYIIEGTVLSSYIPSENRPSKAVFPLAEPYIQIIDANTANSGLTLYFKAAENNTFKSGDSVKIRMKDADLKHTSNGAVSAYPLVNQIEITGTGDIPEAVTINHTEIADYEAMPVKIENTQLIKAHTTDNSVLWKDSDIWTLEVQNSDITYQMFVSSESPLSSQQKMTGSGYLSGIVLTNGTEIAVNADAISLEGERFISMLEPRFTALDFSADNLTIGIENELELSLKYENGGSREVNGGDIKITSNVDFTAEIDDNYTLKKGNGSIKITVKLTPADYTPVRFTVTGFLEGEQSGELEVVDPVVEDRGNFEGTWTIVGKNSESAGNSNNDAVTVAPLVLTGKQSNYNDSNAATAFNGNNATSPSTYFETSVTINSGTLSLYGFSYVERGSDGIEVVVQYAVGSGSFNEISRYTFNSEQADRSLDLKEITALKSLGAGTSVKFRIIPISENSKDKYGIRNTTAPTVWGNVQ